MPGPVTLTPGSRHPTPVGEVVVQLDEVRAARQRRIADAARMHPALRWVAGDDTAAAHRRDQAGHAACGAPGILTLAPAGTGLCPGCYDNAS